MLALMILTTAVLCGQPTPSLRQSNIGKEDLFAPMLYLVSASAQKPKSWTISHVYIGPPSLLGKTIVGAYEPDPYDGMARISAQLKKPVDLGKGLFWVEEAPSGRVSFLVEKTVPSHFPWRSALDDDRTYVGFTRAAAVLEKIYQANDGDRLNTVDRFVRSGSIDDAMTALWQLSGKWKGKPMLTGAVTDYLIELCRDQSIPIAAQMDAQLALSRERHQWIGSSADLQLIERWVTEPWKPLVPFTGRG